MNTPIIKKIQISLQGISRLIMHNGRLADTSDSITQAVKNARDAYKKNPTADNWETFARLMMEGGLYYTDEIGAYVPEDNLRSMLIKGGAGISKKGQKTYKAAASTLNFECDYGFPILVDGKPVTSIKELLENKRYRFERLVVITRQRVRSVRPVFPNGWECVLVVSYMPSIIEPKEIYNIFEGAGLEVGLGDWRPSSPKPGPFGRFIVKDFKEVS